MSAAARTAPPPPVTPVKTMSVLGGRERPAASLPRSIVTTYGARAATLVAYVALLPIVLQSVGADAYGLYALTVALGAIFQQDLGIGDATTRFIAVAHPTHDVARMRRIAAASLGFSLTAATVMGAAVAIALSLTIAASDVPADLDATAGVLVVLGAVNVFLLLALSPSRQVLVGIGRLDEVNVALIAQAVLRVVLTIIVLTVTGGGAGAIVAVAAVDLGATAAFGAAMMWLRHRRAPRLAVRPRDFSWPVFRELFAMSAHLMVIGLAAVVITQMGGILTAILLPIAATALFSAGQRMYLVVKEITASLATAVLPTAAMRHGGGDGRESHRALYVTGTGYANMLMMLVLVPSLLFLPVVMEAWIGPSAGTGATAAAVVAQILILSLFANNNHLLAVPILTAQGRVRSYAILHTIWAVTGTALAAALGQVLGLPGIALGLAVPIVLLEPIYVAVALRAVGATARTFLVQCLVKPLLPALPLGAALAGVAVWTDADLPGAVLLSLSWAVALLAAYTASDRPLRRMLRNRLATAWGRGRRSRPTREEIPA